LAEGIQRTETSQRSGLCAPFRILYAPKGSVRPACPAHRCGTLCAFGCWMFKRNKLTAKQSRNRGLARTIHRQFNDNLLLWHSLWRDICSRKKFRSTDVIEIIGIKMLTTSMTNNYTEAGLARSFAHVLSLEISSDIVLERGTVSLITAPMSLVRISRPCGNAL
jgi:hypothetical protein